RKRCRSARCSTASPPSASAVGRARRWCWNGRRPGIRIVACHLGLPYNGDMSTPAISQLLYLLDAAFEGTDWHSLLSNLHALTPDDWAWVPPGGRRSIRDIVQHVGSCKFMYHDYAFGDAQLTWDHPLIAGDDAVATVAS